LALLSSRNDATEAQFHRRFKTDLVHVVKADGSWFSGMVVGFLPVGGVVVPDRSTAPGLAGAIARTDSRTGSPRAKESRALDAGGIDRCASESKQAVCLRCTAKRYENRYFFLRLIISNLQRRLRISGTVMGLVCLRGQLRLGQSLRPAMCKDNSASASRVRLFWHHLTRYCRALTILACMCGAASDSAFGLNDGIRDSI
jgi:hypothetical protein